MDLIARTLLEEETLDRDQITSLYNEGKLPERDYKTLNGNLTTDEDVKVNINAKKDDEAVLAPLDERGPEDLKRLLMTI